MVIAGVNDIEQTVDQRVHSKEKWSIWIKKKKEGRPYMKVKFFNHSFNSFIYSTFKLSVNFRLRQTKCYDYLRGLVPCGSIKTDKANILEVTVAYLTFIKDTLGKTMEVIDKVCGEISNGNVIVTTTMN